MTSWAQIEHTRDGVRLPPPEDVEAAMTSLDRRISAILRAVGEPEPSTFPEPGPEPLPEPAALASLPAWWGREVRGRNAAEGLDGWGHGRDLRPLLDRPPQQFAVLELLSATPSAFVYLAIDVTLARLVALKVGRQPDDDHEARLLAAFSHPHVIGVHAVERIDGYTCTVREWADADLAAYAKGQPWRVVVERLREAGEAIAHLHANGLIHGDVKPANILVIDGRSKLADLGLARPPTMTGDPAGTGPFMPPERFAGIWVFEGDVLSWSQTAVVLLERCQPAAPASVTAALRAGLVPLYDRRPSMVQVLEQLDRTLARPRRSRGVATAIAWMAVGMLGAYALGLGGG